MIYITEIVENCSFWIFGDLLEKLRRKLSDFSGISHLLWLNLQFIIIARAPSTLSTDDRFCPSKHKSGKTIWRMNNKGEN